MTTFEVNIESADATPLRLLVAADNWVAAWREGLKVLGVDELPDDSRCVVQDDGHVDIAIPSLKRRFRLAHVPNLRGRLPTVGRPLLVAMTDSGEVTIEVQPPKRKSPKLHRRPLPPHPGPDGEAPLANALRSIRTTAPGVADDEPSAQGGRDAQASPAPETPDPIARVLSELERQRLMSRPVRISSETGLPTTDVKRARARLRQQPEAPRLEAKTDEYARPPQLTRPFDTVPVAQLPQLFHQIDAGRSPDESSDAMLVWAVETAWQHVPCDFVMIVDCGDGCELVVGRSEHESEIAGSWLDEAATPLPLGRAGMLRRFSEPRELRFQHPSDPGGWGLEVSSLLSAPILLRDEDGQGVWILLINSTRSSGFTDGELRAVSYLARTVASRS